MRDALRHLDVVGNGPPVRALMLARTAELEGLGITRDAGEFDRLLVQPVGLASGASVRVAYRQPVDAKLVWDFYRTGDLAALQQALGTPPAYAQAAALARHLDALLERAASGHPQHLDSLLPRLQAECARPQPYADLEAATRRAQDRWEHHAAELDTLAGLNSELA